MSDLDSKAPPPAANACAPPVSGSPGDPPVPSGDAPDGTEESDRANGAIFAEASAATVPVGGSPTGAGESPALPVSRESRNRSASDSPVSPSARAAVEFKQQLAILQTLASSPFHQHFLERFLGWLGRPLHLPWWGVHALLYGVTVALFVAFGNIHAQFPRGGYFSLIGTGAEFLFTTYLLWHIRQSRTQAFMVAARMTSGPHRLIWLRRYWGPLHWGWTVPLSGPSGTLSPSDGERVGVRGLPFRNPKSEIGAPNSALGTPHSCRLPVWCVTVLLLGLFYATLLWTRWHPGPFGDPALRFPHELCVYTDVAKAAMIVAVLSSFWTLYGFTQAVRGRYPTSMNRQQRLDLVYHCHQSVLRLSWVVGLTTGLWLFAYGLDHGFTRWSWWWSFWLAVMFATNHTIIRNRGRRPFHFLEAIRGLAAEGRTAFGQATGVFRPAELVAVIASVASPVGLNALGVFAGKFWIR
jgi:hypothetical protein